MDKCEENKIKKSKSKINLIMLLMIFMLIVVSGREVQAASSVMDVIKENDEFKPGLVYITNQGIYYKDAGSVTSIQESAIIDAIVSYSKSEIEASGKSNFNQLNFYKDWVYGGDLQGINFIESPPKSLIYGGDDKKGTWTIDTDIPYKLALPAGDEWVIDEDGERVLVDKSSYYSLNKSPVKYVEGVVADGVSAFYSKVIEAMKKGVMIGSVGEGLNVGVVYANEPIEINKVMTKRKAKGIKEENGKKVEYELDGDVWEFNSSAKKESTMEYYMSPLFGKIDIAEVPKDEAEWDKKIPDVKIGAEGVLLDETFSIFKDKQASDETGLKKAEGLTFKDGVKAYKSDKHQSGVPQSYIDYNMRVVMPTVFVKSSESRYQAYKENGSARVKLVDNYRISVYNNKMYTGDDGNYEMYCTINDLDLTRDYIQLYHYNDSEGKKKGAVMVLRYDEAVADPLNGGEVYMTGRKIHFGGNYLTGLVADTANRDSLYVTTKITGKVGVAPRDVSFPITKNMIGESIDVYNDKKYHIEINNTTQYILFNVDFRDVKTDSSDGENEGVEYDGPKNRFIMLRNNFYVKDGELIDWLRTDEARGQKGVLAEELRKKIQGEMNQIDAITFAEWMRMEEIKNQLRTDKDNAVPRAIGTVMIIIGTFFIIAGIVLPFIYLFDIFNTVTEMSILYMLTSGRLYPVERKDNIVPQGLLSETILVDFKDIAKLTVIMVIIGGLCYEIDMIIGFFLRLYMYIAQFIL